jgi:hypothetical protein
MSPGGPSLSNFNPVNEYLILGRPPYGLVTAPSDADDTSLQYFAITPVW